MTDLLSTNAPSQQTTGSDMISQSPEAKLLPPPSLTVPQPIPGQRNGHLNLDTFSPVNQNGSFAFDRVIKSGEVQKRTRKTKQWKPFHLVLRPNLLSLYKNSTEERLLKQVSLSDLTAVAFLKDPKGRRQNLFGLYSPSRNWHLQAPSPAEAQSWVEFIKQEARIDADLQELRLGSPLAQDFTEADNDRIGSSSPEPLDMGTSPRHSTTRDSVKIPTFRRPSAPSLDYSGDELGPYSDLSDAPESQSLQPQGAFGSFMNRKQRQPIQHHSTPYAAPITQEQPRKATARNASQASGLHVEKQDDEKVIWHGYLLFLKSKGGVRQWKRIWAVLRPKKLAFYKNDEEYAAILILSLSGIIDAVEIDPISKSKKFCMQIIAEEKSYRFCASSEDALAEWLGALKSQLSRRKEKENQPVRG